MEVFLHGVHADEGLLSVTTMFYGGAGLALGLLAIYPLVGLRLRRWGRYVRRLGR